MHRHFLFFLLIGFFSHTAHSEEKSNPAPGVTDKEILLGTTGSFTGQFSSGGLAIRSGLEAALDRANRSGGIHGRSIKLIALDDGYDPKKSKENADELILKKKVFAMVCGNGTAGVSAMLPTIDSTRTPVLFPFAVNPELYDGKNRLLFALAAPISILTQNLADYLVLERKFKKIGAFANDDKSGTGIISEMAPALKRYTTPILKTRTHSRFETKFAADIEDLKKTGAETIVLATNTVQAIEFIKQSSAKGYHPSFAAVFSATVDTILQGLKDDALKTLDFAASEPVPRLDESISLFNELKEDVKTIPAEHSPRVIHGYVAGRILIEALKRAGRDLTREKLITSLETLSNFDLGGLAIDLSAQKHYALPNGFMYRLKDGKAEKVKMRIAK